MRCLKSALLLVGLCVIISVRTPAYKLNAVGHTRTSFSTAEDNCDCRNSTCSCCQSIVLSRFSNLACVNVTAGVRNNNVSFTLTLGPDLYLQGDYSELKPWPSCVEFDKQVIAHVCVMFYNVTYSSIQVSGCLKLSVLVQTPIIIPLNCFTLQRPKTAVVKGVNGLEAKR
ncbi:uncharacterized protein [Montipora foliosa]|uniref:uncharacterized protein n=1 Tax=Montipora foliosa TaxID=591990 RepID=UPI0035F1CBEF